MPEEIKLPPKPELPCYICKGTKWWWRPSRWSTGGDWLCETCRPPLKESEK